MVGWTSKVNNSSSPTNPHWPHWEIFVNRLASKSGAIGVYLRFFRWQPKLQITIGSVLKICFFWGWSSFQIYSLVIFFRFEVIESWGENKVSNKQTTSDVFSWRSHQMFGQTFSTLINWWLEDFSFEIVPFQIKYKELVPYRILIKHKEIV